MVLCTAAISGCGGDVKKIAFDEISRLPKREVLNEVEIGYFIIPVHIGPAPGEPAVPPPSPIQLKFQLVAIVPPSDEKKVEQLLERHKGKIRDEVIRVCRGTEREDLLESEWATLKSHLLDAIQPLLGGDVVRGLATPTISRDEL